MVWTASILTLFPEMFPGPLGESLAGQALAKGLWNLDVTDIRDFTTDRHKSVDDTPAGGGAGMVIRPDVLGRAIESVNYDRIIYMSPRGRIFNQNKSRELLGYDKIAIICGRYEGIDQRVIDFYNVEEISIGDFVLSGGEIAAFAVIDTCIRQIDGVLGNPDTCTEESFASGKYCNLLEYPLYTSPAEWKGMSVPDILRSGNHALINEWRITKSQEITEKRRSDLWKKYLNYQDKNKE